MKFKIEKIDKIEKISNNIGIVEVISLSTSKEIIRKEFKELFPEVQILRINSLINKHNKKKSYLKINNITAFSKLFD